MLTFDEAIAHLYYQGMTYFGRLTGMEPSELTVDFLPEITRYFLSDAIDDRVKFLANFANKPEVDLRSEVTQEYQTRLDAAIRRVFRVHSMRWHRFRQMKDFSEIKLPTQFTDEICNSPLELLHFMRARAVFLPGKLGPNESLALFGVFVRAVQDVTLDIIRIDYPSTGAAKEVPSTAQVVIRKTLRRLAELQRVLQSTLGLKSAAKAEAELRVLVARAKGAASLPLRPIPTSPLSSNDLAKHYVGRPDEDAWRLARQIRHADGTILVTGYRGVGKSSFVNRVVFHALEAQKEIPSDDWLIVPVTVNLAKVAGVQNILRITLRSVRDALLEPNRRSARPIPGYDKSIPLPLSTKDEIEPLEEAYIRATYKVTMSQAAGSEKRSDFGSSISIDPGKWIGGGLVGIELGKFLEAGIKNTKTEKINRELSLLDFDENAAEESLAQLIRSLATLRPLFPGGPPVRIKLVFVFDELDKMDFASGVKPMIEGLKNLFLQQYSVFILVTSKGFYYKLLEDRAIEDAMLNSYFSAIVHVPLLSFAQARKMVDDWVDWNATEQLQTPAPAESRLIDQLTRVLVYRSFGNPRDIIRELRLMQDWADTADQPYLTDRLSKSPNLQIFAAIQDCVEKTAVPEQITSSLGSDGDGSVALVSERMVGDEGRLEQIRRGLYILVEELINRQILRLESPPQVDPVDPKKILLSPLEKIQQDNFSLLSLDDVRQLTRRLGGYLSLMHDSPDLFLTPDWGTRAPLFEMQDGELRVTKYFYALTGRQVVVATTEPSAVSTQAKPPDEELINEAHHLAAQASWSAKSAAIDIIKRLGSDKLTADLKKFLWKVAEKDPDPNHRLAAAERLPPVIDSQDDIKRIAERLTKETVDSVLSILIGLLSGASGDEARKSATDAIVGLIQADTSSTPVRKLSDSTAIAALTVLQTVVSHDVTSELLQWLIVAGKTELVQTTAISVLKKTSEQFGVDVADKIISNNITLELFTTGQVPRLDATGLSVLGQIEFLNPYNRVGQANVLKPYLRELLRAHPLAYASKLLRADAALRVNDLLTYIWEVAFSSPEATIYIFQEILSSGANLVMQQRLHDSLRKTPDFQVRILPYFRRQLTELVEKKTFTGDQAKTIEATLKTLEATPEPAPPKVGPSQGRVWDYETFVTGVPRRGSSSFINDTEFSRRTRTMLLIGGVLVFLPGFFFYKGDLPVQASFGTVVASRLLLLLLDAFIIYPFVHTIAVIQSRFREQSTSPMPNVTQVMLFPLGYTFYYLHIKYIGPLHFWPQALQFIINWPAVISFLMAFRLYKPNS